MVAQRANNDIALVADGEGARQRCCARRRHGCEHQWQKLPREAMAREKAGRWDREALLELAQLRVKATMSVEAGVVTTAG